MKLQTITTIRSTKVYPMNQTQPDVFAQYRAYKKFRKQYQELNNKKMVKYITKRMKAIHDSYILPVIGS